MARSFAIVALIVSAFCISSVLANEKINFPATKGDFFVVNGQVICDPCAFGIQTRLCKPLEGIKVTLECIKGEKNVTFKTEGTTDKDGFYTIVCKGDHKEDVCMVKPENKKGTCTHLMGYKPDRIVPTKNVGPDSVVRVLTTLIFREKKIAPDCERLEKQFGVDKI